LNPVFNAAISVCDDYSLPIDFVKKRPSSFDPCLVQHIPTNWASPSPQSEHVSFLEPLLLQQPLSAVPTIVSNNVPGSVTIASSGIPPGTGTIGRPSLPLVPSASGPALCPIPALQPGPDAATTAAAHTVAIKTLEEIFDTRRSYKPAGRHRARSRTRRPDSCSEVKYINQNFSSGSSAPISSEEEDNDEEEDELSKIPELNSPDSISDDLVQALPLRQSPIKTTGPDTAKRNPSPYYYSDLLKNKQREREGTELIPADSGLPANLPTVQQTPSTEAVRRDPPVRYKKSSSLDTPGAEKEVPLPKRYSITEEGVRIIRCDSPSTTTSDDSDCSECCKRRAWQAQALAITRATCNLGPRVDSMPPHRLLGPAAVCACATPQAFGDDDDNDDELFLSFYVHQPGAADCADCALGGAGDLQSSTPAQDEMANVRTRQIYETAFDSKITRSDDDLDEVDRITNQSVLLQLTKSNSSSASNMVTGGAPPPSRTKRLETKRTKSASSKTPSGGGQDIAGAQPALEEAKADQLAQDLQEKLQLDKQMDNIANANSTSSSQLPLRGYTPSPPSTAPLPMKFPGKHERFFISSIKSAPNLPSSNAGAQHPRLKDLRLDIQNVRNNDGAGGSSCDGSIAEGAPFGHGSKVGERPRSTLCLEPERVLELKRGHRGASHHHHGKQQHQRGRGNFSSTESMATSSSGGSMESLKSSTSEGNRSTSSSDSRHSSSLSSHSSDSGPSLAFPLRVPVAIHNKLNILSPISDKSSQEPGSETSDINNRNNNSQKQSPVDGTTGGGGAVAGAGSGTLSKKEGEESVGGGVVGTEAVKTNVTKRRSAPNKALLLITGPEIQGSDSGISLHSREDLKSRTNFLNASLQRASLGQDKQGDHGKGQSGLPQDLSDLPFDMPKLRRRRAHLQQQSLTLNLNECGQRPPKKFGTLDLGLNLGTNRPNVDLIDASIPLDRQGWYHGSISRIDAEKILRPLSEGSFLVRNSESTRQDYSLTLKSAKGFMHMRIQRDADSGQFILGQFSRPFPTIPDMIRHFCLNRLPVRGAEHMCLLEPVIAQIL
uniref:SH2 domain-containing adapter protein D n=1 Tax=Anopheles coluzzii TaxID=1518534 RepID=A0A8W7PAE5_ANOCL